MNVEAALDYARKHDLRALIVASGTGAAERHFGEDWDVRKPHALYSGTKSFWGIAALHAQSDGLLDLDERVAETFVAWDDDARKRHVTLRMLLNLTSGFGFGGLGSAVPTYERALATPLKNDPGTTFTYGGIPLQVFGAVFARKLETRRQTPHEYLRASILDPIGMRVERWRTLTDGTHPFPTGAFVAADEWLKYGQFALRGAPADALHGSPINPRYGLGWWLGSPGAPDDLFYASGSGGQALYVVPSLDTVVVHFGGSASYKHDAFLKRLFS